MGEDTDVNENGAVDEGSELDPRTAATLLEQAKRRAQRQFEFPSPLLTLIQAGAVLAAYGAIWLSVRGQNPYSGPSYPALAALYAFVAVAAIAATWEGRRACAGPVGVWGVAGAGICAVLVCRAIVQVWLRRA